MPRLKLYANTTSLDSGHVHRIVAFGDSLTEGSLHSGQKFHPYTTQLEMKLNDEFNYTRFQVLNEGVSGETAYVSMATRLPKLLERMSWMRIDLVIILGGTNDLRKLDCSKYVNVAYEIIHLHKIVHDKGIYTLLSTIPENAELGDDCEQNRKKVNAKLKNYAAHDRRNDTLFLDLSEELPLKSLSPEERQLYWDDNIHPSRLGYDKMAELMFQAIREMYHVSGVPETRKISDSSDDSPPTSPSPTTFDSSSDDSEEKSISTTDEPPTTPAFFSDRSEENSVITTKQPTESSDGVSRTIQPTEKSAGSMVTGTPLTTPFWPETSSDP